MQFTIKHNINLEETVVFGVLFIDHRVVQNFTSCHKLGNYTLFIVSITHFLELYHVQLQSIFFAT